jgi:RNA polymerase sigma factor (sigma-70 family)
MSAVPQSSGFNPTVEHLARDAPTFPRPAERRDNSAAAIHQLFDQHKHLVPGIARGYLRGKPGYLDREDIEQYGYVGLMTAAARFNPEGSSREFSGFASRHILGAIQKGRAEERGIAPGILAANRRIRHVERAHIAAHGRPPSPEELAQALGVSVERALALRREALIPATISLSESRGQADNDGVNLEAVARPRVAPASNVFDGDQKLKHLTASLPPKQRRAIRVYFGRHKISMQEVAKETNSGATGLIPKALQTLKNRINPMEMNNSSESSSDSNASQQDAPGRKYSQPFSSKSFPGWHFSAVEAAQRAGVTPQQIYKACETGQPVGPHQYTFQRDTPAPAHFRRRKHAGKRQKATGTTAAPRTAAPEKPLPLGAICDRLMLKMDADLLAIRQEYTKKIEAVRLVSEMLRTATD